ncbi:hypothetical protein FHS95_002074 [Sphingomonas naasensis]|uniref:Uncharacterized protein n=1 Tax=Sphingomonas naasensis TaxID=1344951 RepID=A0A4S1WR08_9SPHN|nr:hypothetical protein [Sphingomonas naasensis]NIJ20382.1 hypothetical protein [Sphingomonas naasensis]TGX44490.1 hypothetical protein E5A74_06850 [Sphingomonas naasensis]
MRNIEASHDAGPARERIGEILRSALGAPDEAALEDETRRLMLRLSLEPLENEGAGAPQAALPPRRRPLLRRLLGRAGTPAEA